MCSWCWGYRPVWLQLKAALPVTLKIQNVLGGLAPDTDEVMPPELQAQIQAHWRRVESELGTRFNFDFWTKNQPRRATYKACRAVLAASLQGHEEAMIEAIQNAYYVRALNPSQSSVLVQLAVELSLDVERFRADLDANKTHQLLARQVAFSRASQIAGFPSLVLARAGQQQPVQIDYKDYRVSLAQIKALSNEH